MPPGRYHKLQRLTAARQAFLDARPSARIVTETAMDFGFWHLGRFSLAYKAPFHQSPSETPVKKMRRM